MNKIEHIRVIEKQDSEEDLLKKMSEALEKGDREEYFRLLDLQCLGNGYYNLKK